MFIGTLAGGLLAAPLAAEAQQPSTLSRVGFCYFGSRESSGARYTAFLEGMRELGYVEGQNLIVEARFGDSRPECLPGLAAGLVGSKIEATIATGNASWSRPSCPDCRAPTG